jgi:enoyl-CoA hydratase/carnithine racemase
MPDILLERAGGRADIILNRPDRKNAITGPLAIELAAAIGEAAADDGVNVIVLQGAGGAFCSGLDLKEFRADPSPEWLGSFSELWKAVHLALFRCPKPVIGALERYAINGGSSLALACDLLVAGESAFLQVGEIQMNTAAPMTMAWLAIRHSEAVTARLTLIGDRVPGPELLRLGVATDVVADDEVLERARALADTIAGYGAGAAPMIKRGFRRLAPGPNAAAWFDRGDAPPRRL